MNEQAFEKALSFIYRNARPLDLALWRYAFEGGSRKDVIDILSYYQNADGGFGHAIEPDFWNTDSTPIGTWKAICILKEIVINENDVIVQKILRYLDSGKDYIDGKWFNTVKSNNDHPHAIWWECNDPVGVPSDNPTISLVGFALRYAKKDSALYKRAHEIAVPLVKAFIKEPICDMHITPLYLELYEYCTECSGLKDIDLAAFKSALYEAISKTVCHDHDKWLTEYVCKPSVFYDRSGLLFDILGRDLCLKEGEMLIKEQLVDGSYPVPWLWHNDYNEYYVAANWWKSSMLRINMLYLKDLKLI
ncbi:MAG: hypothetical protein HDT28_03780 [Clostridiales bacterium]|nr:hypothetical protein [Clostridiales bacterium]